MPEATHPGFAGAVVKYEAEELPTNTELATAVTIQRMDEYIRQDANSSQVAAAVDAAAHPMMRFASPGATLQWIFAFVKGRVSFWTDARTAAAIAPVSRGEQLPAPPAPWAAEVLIRPVDLLRMSPATGDCDDFAMLTAAMLIRAGFGAALCTIAADPKEPDQWSHVYAIAIDPATGEHTAMDTSHGSGPGWEYPHFTRRKVWMVQEPMSQKTLGETLDLNNFGWADPGASTAPTSNSGLGLWQQLAVLGAKTGSAIATARYGQAPTGTYVQSGPNGTTYFRQGEGSSFQFPTVGVSNQGLGTVLAIAGVGLVALAIFSRR